MALMRDLTASYLIGEMIDKIEGVAYTDIATDKGGKTKFGVIEATYNSYKHLWAKHNYNGIVKDAPRSLAEEIYLIGFWNKISEIFLGHYFCSQINLLTHSLRTRKCFSLMWFWFLF